MKKVLKLYRDKQTNEVVYKDVRFSKHLVKTVLGDLVNKKTMLFTADLGEGAFVIAGVEDKDSTNPTLVVVNPTMDRVVTKYVGDVYIFNDGYKDIANPISDEDVDGIVENLFVVGGTCFVRTSEENINFMANYLLSLYKEEEYGLVYSNGKFNDSSIYIGDGTHILDLRRFRELCQV